MMNRLLLAWALLCAAGEIQAQDPAPPPQPAPTATTTEAPGSPKIKEAVDLSEPSAAENIEIPPPADEETPEKSAEITGTLPDEEESAPAVPVTGQVEVTAKNKGQIVRAAVGNLVAITLPSNPSTGYNWELRDFDYGAADYYKSETVPADGGNVLFGAPGNTVITLQAVKAGQQEVNLAYRRTWDAPDQAAETFTFRLLVDGTEPPAP
jgi:inhibitor of cysteine peptidase